MSLRQALRARFRSPEKPDGGKESASAEEPSTSAGLSASWKTLEEDEDEERRNSQVKTKSCTFIDKRYRPSCKRNERE